MTIIRTIRGFLSIRNTKKAGHIYNTKYSIGQMSGQVYVTQKSDIEK